jgi:hypothetical protein
MRRAGYMDTLYIVGEMGIVHMRIKINKAECYEIIAVVAQLIMPSLYAPSIVCCFNNMIDELNIINSRSLA